jgi:hypothetical protein
VTPGKIHWPQTDEELLAGIDQHGVVKYAAAHGTSKDSLRRELERRGLKRERRVAATVVENFEVGEVSREELLDDENRRLKQALRSVARPTSLTSG